MLKLVVISIGAAFATALCMFRDFLLTGEDPGDDGPRAVVAEFLGSWFGTSLFILSFTVSSKTTVWELRGAAAVTLLIGIGFWYYFANSTEVSETPDQEPTGFKNDTTDLHLQ